MTQTAMERAQRACISLGMFFRGELVPAEAANGEIEITYRDQVFGNYDMVPVSHAILYAVKPMMEMEGATCRIEVNRNARRLFISFKESTN